jgi:hypothetical protein
MLYDIAGAILGILIGAWIAPANAGEQAFGMYVLGGAILGVTCGQLVVRVIDRWFSINLARVIGYGTLGAGAALSASVTYMPMGKWSMSVIAAIVLAGFVLGALFGESVGS